MADTPISATSGVGAASQLRDQQTAMEELKRDVASALGENQPGAGQLGFVHAEEEVAGGDIASSFGIRGNPESTGGELMAGLLERAAEKLGMGSSEFEGRQLSDLAAAMQFLMGAGVLEAPEGVDTSAESLAQVWGDQQMSMSGANSELKGLLSTVAEKLGKPGAMAAYAASLQDSNPMVGMPRTPGSGLPIDL